MIQFYWYYIVVDIREIRASELRNRTKISKTYTCSFSMEERARVTQWVRSLDLTTHTSLSPIRRGFVPGSVNNKKRCTRLAAASENVYQLLAYGRWFSPGTPASSTTKTGRHDIAEILLKVALNTKNSNSFNYLTDFSFFPLWKTLKVTGHHQNK